MTRQRWIPVALLLGLVGAVAAAGAEPALGGLDPVMLVAGEEVEGEAEITVLHEGLTYVFSSKKTKKTFEKAPERYAIQNRTCPVVPGAPADPAIFTVHDEKIYIFATSGCADEFDADPERFLDGAAESDNESES